MKLGAPEYMMSGVHHQLISVACNFSCQQRTQSHEQSLDANPVRKLLIDD